jgi:hypothetical protein
LVDPESVLGADVVAEDSEELLGGAGGVGCAVAESLGSVLGEAEGDVRSRSVPPTRSLLSVQPASTAVPSASTQKPVSNFFIVVPPSRIRTVR